MRGAAAWGPRRKVPTYQSPAEKWSERASFLTIGVDFHGVLVEHPEGSKGATSPDWPEVPGAIEWLRGISGRYNVHVVSARFARSGNEGADAIAAARQWLSARGIPLPWMLPVNGAMPRIWLTPFKPPCVLWIDDRGWTFRGVFPSAEEIAAFRPWNR